MACIALISLLCLASSLHACSSARLLPSIEVEKAKLSDESTSIEYVPSQQKQEEEARKINNERISQNGNGANGLKMVQPDQPAIIQGNDLTTKPISHSEFKPSNVEFTKGQNGKTFIIRSMLGSGPEDTEEDVDTKENKTSNVEDIDMMDYAQPHRKPPIHNERP